MSIQRRPAECRRFLAEALSGFGDGELHSVDCVACRELLARCSRLGAAVAVEPTPPPVLARPEFLSGVYELAILSLEGDARGESLRAAMRQAPPSSALEVELFEGSRLAAGLTTVAKQPSAQQWSRMRMGLLAEARLHPAASTQRKWLLILGLAASAIAYVTLDSGPVVAPSEIVFLDIEARPLVEFAILRGGAGR